MKKNKNGKPLDVLPTLDSDTRAALYELLAIVAEQTGRKMPDRDTAAEEILLRAVAELDEEQKAALEVLICRTADNVKAERARKKRESMKRKEAIYAQIDAELEAEEQGCTSLTMYRVRHHKKLPE